MRIALVLGVLLAGDFAEAQPIPYAPVTRDIQTEHGLLVGACLAAIEEATRFNPLERHVLLPEADRDCRNAPGQTLYKIKGGRVFDWSMAPGPPARR